MKTYVCSYDFLAVPFPNRQLCYNETIIKRLEIQCRINKHFYKKARLHGRREVSERWHTCDVGWQFLERVFFVK